MVRSGNGRRDSIGEFEIRNLRLEFQRTGSWVTSMVRRVFLIWRSRYSGRYWVAGGR